MSAISALIKKTEAVKNLPGTKKLNNQRIT